MKKTVPFSVAALFLFTACAAAPSQVEQPLQTNDVVSRVTINEDSSAVFIAFEENDDEGYQEFEQEFTGLLSDAKEAWLYTYALAYFDYEKGTADEYRELRELVLRKWEQAEKSADAFADLGEDAISFELIRAARAMPFDGYNPRTEADMPRLDPEHGGYRTFNEKEVDLWEEVEIKRKANPGKDFIRIVAEQFGTTAREAQQLIEKHYSRDAQEWRERLSNYENSSIMMDSLAEAAKAEVKFFLEPDKRTEVLLGVNGEEAVVVPGKDKTEVYIANERRQTQVAVADPLDTASGPLQFLSFRSLSGGDSGKPSNIVQFANWVESKYDNIFVDVRDDGVVIDPNVSVQSISQSEEDLISMLPAEFSYRQSIIDNEYYERLKNEVAPENDVEVVTEPESSEQFSYKGVWRGNALVKWEIFDANMDVSMKVTADNEVKYDIAIDTSYALGGGVSTDYQLSGTATGVVVGNRVDLAGDFTSVTKTNVPAGVSVPPEAAKYLQPVTTSGTLTVDGVFTDSTAAGSVSFGSEYGVIDGEWSAEVK